jgi:hypothetical protein
MKNRSLGHIPNYTADFSLRQITGARYMNSNYQNSKGNIYPAALTGNPWYVTWCFPPAGCVQKCVRRYGWTYPECVGYCDRCWGR